MVAWTLSAPFGIGVPRPRKHGLSGRRGARVIARMLTNTLSKLTAIPLFAPTPKDGHQRLGLLRVQPSAILTPSLPPPLAEAAANRFHSSDVINS